MAKLTRLTDLHLDQDGINPMVKTRGDRSQRWYVFEEECGGLRFYTSARFADANGPTPYAVVRVILPMIMVGDPGEIRSDIAKAVVRHAESIRPLTTATA